MPLPVSIVVDADPTVPPRGLFASIDSQTVSADDFEVVVVPTADDEAFRRSLERLAARRPNVVLAAVGSDWRSAASGSFVLRVRLDQRLFPESVQRLHAHAERHGLDVVAGRVAGAARPQAGAFLADHDELTGSSREAALGAPLRLVRTEVLGADGDVEGAADGLRVGSLSTYPAGIAPPPPRVDGPRATVGALEAHWADGAVIVAVSGSVSGAAAPGLEAALALRQVGPGTSFLVPVQWQPSTGDETSWRMTGRVDPLTAAAGSPLSSGRYHLDVLLGGATEAAPPAAVPGVDLPPAFVGDLVVTATTADGRLELDVGPTAGAVVSGVPASAAVVTESAAGTRLTLPLPGAHVRSSATYPAAVALKGFRLPAAVETSSGTAVLTAYLSGLAGSYPLSVAVGSSPLRPTGLTVVVAGDGVMRVVDTPPAPEATPAAPAPGAASPTSTPTAPSTSPAGPTSSPTRARRRKRKRKPARRPATGPVARLRRAVPAALEPAVARLSRQPLARALYRRLTGLAGSGRRH